MPLHELAPLRVTKKYIVQLTAGVLALVAVSESWVGVLKNSIVDVVEVGILYEPRDGFVLLIQQATKGLRDVDFTFVVDDDCQPIGLAFRRQNRGAEAVDVGEVSGVVFVLNYWPKLVQQMSERVHVLWEKKRALRPSAKNFRFWQ